MIRRITGFALSIGVLCVATSTHAIGAVYDLKADWSDAANPNSVWTYREGNNALPHVASWQSSLGGYTSPQPGWARSENGSDRVPFWHKSLGFENFVHDYQAGDIVVHTQDDANGIGQGPANVLWTSPGSGPVAAITGSVWMGRDIGRANHWALLKNSTILSQGDIASGDPYSRATPFNLAAGTGGPAALANIPISTGDTLQLRLTQTGGSGDFVGVNFTVTTGAPEPATLSLLLGVAFPALARRRR
jgi:hypothetical protein